MNSKPILFKPELAKSINLGIKTQTRRIVKPQPMVQGRSDNRVEVYKRGDKWEVKDLLSSDGFSILDSFECPYGKVGDTLWVRETWCYVLKDHAHDLLEGWRDHNQYVLKSMVHDDWMEYAKEKYGYKWKPSIHMPKIASRILLRIKDIRVERVNSISKVDSMSEGIEVAKNIDTGDLGFKNYWRNKNFPDAEFLYNPIHSFQSIWNSIHVEPKPIQKKINGKLTTVGYEAYHFDDRDLLMFSDEGFESWKGLPLKLFVNPWVWVIEFEKVEGGINE